MPSTSVVETLNNRCMNIDMRSDNNAMSSATNKSNCPQKRNLAEMVRDSGKKWSVMFDDDSEDDDDCTAQTEGYGDSESEEETEIAHVMVKQAFSRTPSAPDFGVILRSVIAEQAAKKKLKLNNEKAVSTNATVRHSTSAPNLPILIKQSVSSSDSLQATNNAIAPQEYLRQRFAQQQLPAPKLHSFRSVPASFFHALQPCHIRAYNSALVRAVRDQDVNALMNRKDTLYAGNKFGETILHAACRRGAADVVHVLLDHGLHPVRVCCDAGRTILHDAAWTCTPSWEVMDAILDVCPDLLYIQDVRGNTPLEYVPAKQWQAWCVYLEKRSVESLRPTLLA